MKILVLNGPNLNMLDYRKKEIYGKDSLKKINKELKSKFKKNKFIFKQSNFEGEIVAEIHKAIKKKYDGIIINPGAFSHYSYAIRDALEMFKNKKVEVHLSDVLKREEFRKKLVNKEVVDEVISGFGKQSYFKAVEFMEEK